MCGIAGFISANRQYDAEKVVSKMLAVMCHRGPDQTAFRNYGQVTLGMTRLSIIDKETHRIPYEDDSGNYSIVYNGEVYNHDSIRSSLASKYNFLTASDAETVLCDFVEKGVRSFDDFNGMYGFAVYDGLKRATYLVRDKTGEKPLYYMQGKDFFAFASEMKGLLEVVPAEFNSEAVSYSAYEFTVGPETLFKDIFCLGPG